MQTMQCEKEMHGLWPTLGSGSVPRLAVAPRHAGYTELDPAMHCMPPMRLLRCNEGCARLRKGCEIMHRVQEPDQASALRRMPQAITPRPVQQGFARKRAAEEAIGRVSRVRRQRVQPPRRDPVLMRRVRGARTPKVHALGQLQAGRFKDPSRVQGLQQEVRRDRVPTADKKGSPLHLQGAATLLRQ